MFLVLPILYPNGTLAGFAKEDLSSCKVVLEAIKFEESYAPCAKIKCARKLILCDLNFAPTNKFRAHNLITNCWRETGGKMSWLQLGPVIFGPIEGIVEIQGPSSKNSRYLSSQFPGVTSPNLSVPIPLLS